MDVISFFLFNIYTQKNIYFLAIWKVHFINQVGFFSESVVNYVAPRADTEFEDVSYDGDMARSLMTGGLGMLTDSLYGADDFLQFDLQFHKPLSEYFIHNINVQKYTYIMFITFKTQLYFLIKDFNVRGPVSIDAFLQIPA